MTKHDARKIAEEYILKHKERFKTGRNRVTKKEIDAAVERVAKALEGLSSSRTKVTSNGVRRERARGRAA